MYTKSTHPQEITLVILGNQRFTLRKKVFDSRDFILPSTRVGSQKHEPKSRKEKISARVRVPLSDRQIEINKVIFGEPNPFHHLSKAIDTSQLSLSIPQKGIEIKVEDFRNIAQEAMPEGEKIGVVLDTYTKKHYNRSYSDLVSDARNVVIARFKAAFSKNIDYDRMSREFQKDKDIFLHHPVWAPQSAIKEYKQLAKQGHVYSQYLAGVLLASCAGGYSVKCVDYLLMAYENKHPEALRVLAEFLNFKNDLYGAVQCALLSIHGGDGYSEKIVREVLGQANLHMVQTNNGMAPLSFVIIDNLRANGFDSILSEYFSEFNPDPQPEVRLAGFLIGGLS